LIERAYGGQFFLRFSSHPEETGMMKSTLLLCPLLNAKLNLDK